VVLTQRYLASYAMNLDMRDFPFDTQARGSPPPVATTDKVKDTQCLQFHESLSFLFKIPLFRLFPATTAVKRGPHGHLGCTPFLPPTLHRPRAILLFSHHMS
jgi:hypothetical protein